MSLVQLVYYSRNAVGGDMRAKLQELRNILEVSQKNNTRDDISGALIFDKNWFLQILEGPLDKVQATYDRIAQDKRHSGAKVMKTTPISERKFADWAMGGMVRRPETQEVFLRHGISGELDPPKMQASQVVALALDLRDFEAAAAD